MELDHSTYAKQVQKFLVFEIVGSLADVFNYKFERR